MDILKLNSAIGVTYKSAYVVNVFPRVCIYYRKIQFIK